MDQVSLKEMGCLVRSKFKEEELKKSLSSYIILSLTLHEEDGGLFLTMVTEVVIKM